MNRILWNRRPTSRRDCGDIDEIVLHDARTVHVEQMDERCWWIGIDLGDGRYWSGNFTATSRCVMTFGEQENNGIVWEHDRTHEALPENGESPAQPKPGGASPGGSLDDHE